MKRLLFLNLVVINGGVSRNFGGVGIEKVLVLQFSSLHLTVSRINELMGSLAFKAELSGTKNFVSYFIPNLKPLFLFRSVPKFEKKTIPKCS